MKTFEFPCWASCGKLDSSNWEWDFTVSDEEALRLAEAAKNDDTFGGSTLVQDIYDRLYSEMLEEQADVYLGEDDLMEEVIDALELDEDTELTRDDVIEYLETYYSFGIGFPEVLLNAEK